MRLAVICIAWVGGGPRQYSIAQKIWKYQKVASWTTQIDKRQSRKYWTVYKGKSLWPRIAWHAPLQLKLYFDMLTVMLHSETTVNEMAMRLYIFHHGDQDVGYSWTGCAPVDGCDPIQICKNREDNNNKHMWAMPLGFFKTEAEAGAAEPINFSDRTEVAPQVAKYQVTFKTCREL